MSMQKEDLTNYTQDELKDLIVELINGMEKTGNEFMDYYIKSKDKDFDVDKYAYAAGLLSQVNKVKAMVALKNEPPQFLTQNQIHHNSD